MWTLTPPYQTPTGPTQGRIYKCKCRTNANVPQVHSWPQAFRQTIFCINPLKPVSCGKKRGQGSLKFIIWKNPQLNIVERPVVNTTFDLRTVSLAVPVPLHRVIVNVLRRYLYDSTVLCYFPRRLERNGRETRRGDRILVFLLRLTCFLCNSSPQHRFQGSSEAPGSVKCRMTQCCHLNAV